MIVHIQFGGDGGEIEVSLPVRFQGSHVAPVRLGVRIRLHARVRERMGKGLTSFRHFRDNILTEIVIRGFILVILFKQLKEILCVEDIDPHAGQRLGVIPWHGRRIGWLLNEIDYFFVFIYRHHAERRGFCFWYRQAGDGTACAFLNVVDQHARVVLLIDVIAREDDNILRVVAANDVEVLGDRIRRAAIPVFTV